MAELTQEQLERAVEKFREAGLIVVKDGGVICKNDREALRAAAPFLQLPWDDPTDEDFAEAKGNSSYVLGFVLKWVAKRNEALKPKPDPRIDLIDRTLVDFMHNLNNTEERTKAAQAILAALDEVK